MHQRKGQFFTNYAVQKQESQLQEYHLCQTDESDAQLWASPRVCELQESHLHELSLVNVAPQGQAWELSENLPFFAQQVS